MSVLLDRAPSGAAVRPASSDAGADLAEDRLRRFVGGRGDDAVVLTRDPDTLVCRLVDAAPGDVVVLAGDRSVPGARVVLPTRSIDETIDRLESELAEAPAALVVVTAASAITGEVLPVGRLAATAHRHDARILVDAAHLVAHRAISIASWGIDYLYFSSTGLDALFDVHALIGRPDWLRGTTSAAGPGGVGVTAFAASADALASLGFEELGYREQALHRLLDAGLGGLPGVRRLRDYDDRLDRAGAYAFAVDGRQASEVAERLSVRHGVGVCRAVTHALAPTTGAVRVSTGFGTTVDDVDRLVAAVRGLSIG